MTKRAQLADGTVLEFPDNTPDAVMDRVVKQHIAGGAQTNQRPAARPQQRSFGGDVINTLAGIGQGAAAIPDAVTEAIGGGMRLAIAPAYKAGAGLYRALGQEGAAQRVERNYNTINNALARPATIGRGIERIAPTPRDGVGQAVRLASQVVGGAMVPMGPKVTPPTRIPSPPAQVAAQPVVEAAKRVGATVRPAMVNPSVRGRVGALEQSQHGGPIIRNAIADDVAAMEAGVSNVVRGTAYRDNVALGQMAQRTVNNQRTASRALRQNLYDAVEAQAPGFVAPATRTIQAIDDKIASLASAGKTATEGQVKILQGIKSDLQETGLSVASLQAQRKAIRDRISTSGLDMNASEAMLSGIIKGAGDELMSAMKASNPAAAASLLRANAKHAQYLDYRKNVSRLFLGPSGDKPYESAAAALESIVRNKGNFHALRRFQTAATPDDLKDFAATIAQRYGRDNKGNFSPARLASDLRDTPERTLRAVFGRDGAAALRDWQTIANSMVAASSERNASKTGGVVANAANGLKNHLITLFGLSQGGIVGGVAGNMVSNFISRVTETRAARLLMDPDVTKWLRQAPQTTNPAAINGHFAKLQAIASSKPAIAADVQVMIDAVKASAVGLNDNVGVPLAASDGQEDQPEQQQPLP